MNSEVTISLTGEALSTFVPIGATIHYGINRIPVAQVQLDPKSLELLCDFDSIRRTRTTLNVNTTAGCIRFDGIIDGLSYTQTPGGLQTSLVIKHPFQWLDELYPRIIGVHPSANNVFRPQTVLNNEVSSDGKIYQRYDLAGSVGASLDTSVNLVDFIVQLLKLSVLSQKVLPMNAEDGRTMGLQAMALQGDMNKYGFINLILSLLANINTESTSGLDITATDGFINDWALNQVANMSDTLFAHLLRALSDIGCCLVIGNNTAYVLPEASYLNVPKIQSTQRQKRSSLPNIVFPAEYDSYNFNDNGYVNIKGVYVLADQGTDSGGTAKLGGVAELGYYIDTNATGNIMATSLPASISYGLMRASVTGSTGVQTFLKTKSQFPKKKVKIAEYKTAIASMDKTNGTYYAQHVDFMNQWAQMEYCRLKYDDRTGSISTAFHNNWAPGAVGSLYTRLPGSYMDFFVTDVTHTFQMNVPNNGRATTNINFKSGRMGPTTAGGLDKIDMYNYSYNNALAFSKNFVNDISH